MKTARSIRRWIILGLLVTANGIAARSTLADGGFKDECHYGVNPVGQDWCTEYCSTQWGSCGGDCEEADGCSYNQQWGRKVMNLRASTQVMFLLL